MNDITEIEIDGGKDLCECKDAVRWKWLKRMGYLSELQVKEGVKLVGEI